MKFSCTWHSFPPIFRSLIVGLPWDHWPCVLAALWSPHSQTFPWWPTLLFYICCDHKSLQKIQYCLTLLEKIEEIYFLALPRNLVALSFLSTWLLKIWSFFLLCFSFFSGLEIFTLSSKKVTVHTFLWYASLSRIIFLRTRQGH